MKDGDVYHGPITGSAVGGRENINQIINNPAGGTVINPPIKDESGLETLRQGIATEALYDSAQRFPPLKCHPDTRTKIRREIEAWISGTNTQHSVFWLHARAGVGKSAIMQSLAQKLSYPDGNVVATFCFGRGKGKREQGHYLFSTIAYQIALNVPDLRPQINRVMQHKPTIPSTSMDFQVQFLFAGAFPEWKDRPPVPFTILVDGLDECNDHDDQQTILNLIGEIITIHRLPLRFLIASRPEPQIREVFDGPILQEITLRATIADDFTSRMDITNFLRDRFADIYRRKSRFIGKTQGPNWPSEEVIEFLASKSSGQFIYATTVVKFVDDRFRRPQEQLNVILSPTLSQKEAFSYLDSLYMQILSTYRDTEALTRVLGFIVVMSKPVDVVIEDLLGVESGEVELVLQGLHSILTGLDTDAVFPEEDTLAADLSTSSTEASREVHIAHASFSDFLIDPRRSDQYYVDKEEYDALIVTSAFAVLLEYILDCLRGNIRRPISQETIAFVTEELHRNSRRLAILPESIFADLPTVEELERHLQADSSIALEAFLAINKLVMDTMIPGYEHDSLAVERQTNLLHLKHRYLLFLYRCYDLVTSREDHPLHAIQGIFATRKNLSSEALADIFMIDTEIIEENWRTLGLHDHCSMLAETVNILRARYIILNENRDLCKKAEQRNLHICNQLLLRFFERSWIDTPEPSTELSNYIWKYFATHLVGLVIVPSENDSALAFLDTLDGVQVQCESEINTKSNNKFKCMWDLLEAVLDWLTWQLEISDSSNTTEHSDSFLERLRSATNHISVQLFFLISKRGLWHKEPIHSADVPAIRVSEDMAETSRLIDGHISPIVDLEHLESTTEAFFEIIRVWASIPKIDENILASNPFEEVILDYLQTFNAIVDKTWEGFWHTKELKAPHVRFEDIASTGQEIAESALQSLWSVEQKLDQPQDDMRSTDTQELEITGEFSILSKILPHLLLVSAKVLSWFAAAWRTKEIYYLDPDLVVVEPTEEWKTTIMLDRYREYYEKMRCLSVAYADVFELLGYRPEARRKLNSAYPDRRLGISSRRSFIGASPASLVILPTVPYIPTDEYSDYNSDVVLPNGPSIILLSDSDSDSDLGSTKSSLEL